MADLKLKLEIVLAGLREQIVALSEHGSLKEAEFFLEQYIKLAPMAVERYSLEAMLRTAAGDWARAEEVLKAGLDLHPISFDLLYNLGFLYETKNEYFEAYHLYMRARYFARTEDEKESVAQVLAALVPHFAGTVESREEELATTLVAGERMLTVTMRWDLVLWRKEVLECLTAHLLEGVQTVLDIGFQDGLVSKNLNYYGFEVTAVERAKERLLNVIAREWHDNLLQPRQKVAEFHHEAVDLAWLKEIPTFDVIVAVGSENLTAFGASEADQVTLLEELLAKVEKQLFLLVAAPGEGVEKEFSAEVFLKVVQGQGLQAELIGEPSFGERHYQLYVVNKSAGDRLFQLPLGSGVKNSPSTILQVDMEKCTDLYGAAYVGDFQPFVALLEEYKENRELTYRESVLKRYYDNFTPRNQEEMLFAARGGARKLSAGWIGYPWAWNEERKVIFVATGGETRPGGNHHFGLNSDAFGEEEFGRLIHIYKLLERTGYHPEAFSDGYIAGYLLAKGSDHRFIVTEGQHRVACLAALGYERIKVRFTQREEYPRIVLREGVKGWPQVVNRAYSANLALKVFDRFFQPGVGLDRTAKFHKN